MKAILTPLSAKGLRLDVFLQTAQPDVSRSQMQKQIRGGEILVNKKKVSPHRFLQGGEQITFAANPQAPELPKTLPRIPVVAAERDFLIVDKPAGIPVHGGAFAWPGGERGHHALGGAPPFSTGNITFCQH